MKQVDRGCANVLLGLAVFLALPSLASLESPKARTSFIALAIAGALMALALLFKPRSESDDSPSGSSAEELTPLQSDLRRRRIVLYRAFHSALLVTSAIIIGFSVQGYWSDYTQNRFLFGFLVGTSCFVFGLVYLGVALANCFEAAWLSWRVRKWNQQR